MNTTSEKLFQHCVLLNTKYQVLAKIPSKAYFNNMISACSVVMILIIPTILLNGISVVTIRKCSQLREKIVYFLIMVQSLADLAVGLVSLPLSSYICITEAFAKADCFTQRFLIIIASLPFFMSLAALTALTVDRYLSILHPIKHRTMMTKRKITVFLVCAFVFITVATFLSLLKTKVLEDVHDIYLSFFLLLAVFSYTRIFIAIKTRKPPGNVNVVAEREKERKFLKEIKLVKSCFLAVACFFLCLTAGVTILYSQPYEDHTPEFTMFKIWAGTARILNSILNSLIFFWTRPLLRTEAFKVLKKICNVRSTP
jgi:hypothetical protein